MLKKAYGASKEGFSHSVAGFQISLSHLLSVATKEINILFSNIKEKHLHQLKIQVVMVQLSYPPLKFRKGGISPQLLYQALSGEKHC